MSSKDRGAEEDERRDEEQPAVAPERQGQPDEREDGRDQAERQERELPARREVGEAVGERVVRAERDGEQRERAGAAAAA